MHCTAKVSSVIEYLVREVYNTRSLYNLSCQMLQGIYRIEASQWEAALVIKNMRHYSDSHRCCMEPIGLTFHMVNALLLEKALLIFLHLNHLQEEALYALTRFGHVVYLGTILKSGAYHCFVAPRYKSMKYRHTGRPVEFLLMLTNLLNQPLKFCQLNTRQFRNSGLGKKSYNWRGHFYWRSKRTLWSF